MKLLLRVEHPTATGERAVDVEVDVAPSHTSAELTAALAQACRVPDLADRPLLHNPTMRLVLAETAFADSGIVSGDTVTLGAGTVGASIAGTSASICTGAGAATSGAGAYPDLTPQPRPCALSTAINPVSPTGGTGCGNDRESADLLHLVVTSGVDAGASYPLLVGTHTVGRSRHCELTLLDPQISRRDFRIRVGPCPVTHPAPPPPNTPTASPQPPAPSAQSGGGLELAGRGGRALEVTVEPGDDRGNELRVNGRTVTGPASVGAGDDIQVGSTTLQVRAAIADRRRPLAAAGTVPFERTPQFRQPIHVRQFGPLGRVPVKPTPRRFQILAVIAPLVMGCSMAFLFNSPRFLLFAVLSPVVAIGNTIDSRRNGSKDFERKTAELRERLQARRGELAAQLDTERRLRHRAWPDVIELAHQAATFDKRLWNRARRSPDFLELRAGIGTVEPRIDVKDESQGDDDLIAEIADAVAEFDRLVDVPVPINLAEAGVVGLVGATTETASFAGGLALQAACLHSPEDLVIASAIPDDRGVNEWLKWLPHVRSKNSPIGGNHLAGDPDSAATLVRAVSRVAETRSMIADRNLDPRWPWVLLVVDRSLEPDPAITARLLDLGASVGVSVVWLAESDRFVPRQADAVARLRTPGEGVPSRLTYVDPDRATQEFEPVRVGAGVAERAARSLAPLVDATATNAAATVPSLVTLFEALGVDRVDPDWIVEQWLTDRGYALPAPVGLTDAGPLTLDLVRHGPHGLIGGTSGAGKSELVQSLVANLIALNSPERVNLLFIDYKGGALSGLFSAVPHAVGAVTNLDAMLSLRALTSLKAELDRRMALFEDKRVKDIAEMLDRYPAEAPASLVIVVDEFASLVRELPEFVEGIVSIAERGRSLGIHLLLSTQRPSGSINENIQQNTNLRMSLRMLDAGESNNVIGTADAATIPGHLKGRGYARLGPGELIAFQSSWSGAPLGGDDGPRPITIAPFTTLPVDPAEIVSIGAAGPSESSDGNPPGCFGPVDTGRTGPPATELDAVVAAVIEAAQRLGMGRGRAPWLETLPSLVPLTDVLDDPRAATGAVSNVTIGMVDNPEAQDQYPANVDLDDGGGLAVYGSGGSGKTTTLLTTACAAAIRDSRAGGGRLSIFGLDFASRQLGVLAQLPQCEMVANGDDVESVTRVIATITRVFAERQAAVAEAAAANRPVQAPTPILLVIDGYDALAETFSSAGNVAALLPWFDRVVNLVTQGRQVGIYTILATGSMSGPSARLMNTISNRITLRQTDDSAYRSFGIPSTIAAGLELAPGQALTRTGAGMQVAVIGHRPGPHGEPTVDPAAVWQLADGLVGSVLPACETRPLGDEIPLPASTAVAELDRIEIGVADLSFAPFAIDLAINSFCVLGPPRSGRSTSLLSVGLQLESAGADVWAFGPPGSRLQHHTGWTGSAFGKTPEVTALIEQLMTAAEQFPDSVRYLLFDDADRFDDMALNAPLKALLETGIRVCGSAGSSRNLIGSNPLHRELKSARNLLVLKGEDDGAIQAAVGGRYSIRPGLTMTTGRGVLVSDGVPTVVQGYEPGVTATGEGGSVATRSLPTAK